MPEFLTKALEYLWAIFASLFAIIGGLVWYIWDRHKKRVDALETSHKELSKDVTELKAKSIQVEDLDKREKKIMDRVDTEHQRIITTLERAIDTMKEELVTCNQNVMSHIAGLHKGVDQIREFMFQHLERRQDHERRASFEERLKRERE